MKKRLFDVEEIAEYLGVKICTVYPWVSNQEIPHVKIGRLTKFDLGQIDAWILECSVPVEKKEKPIRTIDIGLGVEDGGRGNGNEGGEKIPCSKCKDSKEPDEFYLDKRSKTGRQYWCKKCVRKRSKERGTNEEKGEKKEVKGEKKDPLGETRIIRGGEIVREDAHAQARELLEKKRKAAMGEE